MLQHSKTFSSFAVRDIEQAKKFYSETLGLPVKQDNDMGGMLTIDLPGNNGLIIYPKPDHSPAGFTVLNFVVDNIEATVKSLKDKGVKFESYDLPGLKTDDNNIARGQGPTIAWFTDPSGNILSVLEER